jgi:hypothetical protein
LSYFRKKRCLEFSLIDYLTEQINTDWSGVSVIKSFSQAYKTAIPVICIRSLNTLHNKKEIGNTDLEDIVTIVIDIFAKSDGQRLDLADYLVEKIKVGCVYYNYSHSSANPEVLDKEADGRIKVVSWISDNRIDFGIDVSEYDKFRHILSFTVRKS